jgi:hypothetical protein
MPRKINQSNVKQGAASASSQGGHDDSSGVTALVAGIFYGNLWARILVK